jgi:hypothetical protein
VEPVIERSEQHRIRAPIVDQVVHSSSAYLLRVVARLEPGQWHSLSIHMMNLPERVAAPASRPAWVLIRLRK